MLATLLVAVMSGAPWVAVPGWQSAEEVRPPDELERRIIDRALKCPRMRRAPDPQFLLDLLRIEERAGVPRALRGMVLAAACSESGYNPQARGDRDRQGRPRAIGILQQWPWFEHAYKFDRLDPIAAAEAWFNHIHSHLPGVRKQCGSRLDPETLWVKAWVTAVLAPKKGGRCHQTPKHYIRLKQWRPAWEDLLREERGEVLAVR